MRPWLRVIGDVHQQLKPYVHLALGAEYSVQVGDLGFDYSLLKTIDPGRHKVLAGNHDNYERAGTAEFLYMQTGHWLGDYGVHAVPGFGDIFFVRGGRSIDWKYRTKGEDWWPEEELPEDRMAEALALYVKLRPAFVITHECPGRITMLAFGNKVWDGAILRPSRTANLLDRMWENHRPKNWLFGHHHKEWASEVGGTAFRCVPELGHFDFDEVKQ